MTMCNLYNLKASARDIGAVFDALDASGGALEKDYVSPGRPGLVVTGSAAARQLRTMRWGFPPPPGVRNAVVNVRNYQSPFWRSALADPERRCLVPVTSFQEWSVEPDPITGKKKPHWFSVPSRPIFAFAGIWRPVGDEAAYAFLTTGYEGDPATHVVGAIHPKAMPVILHDDDYERWLTAPVEDALRLAVPFPSQLLSAA